MKYYAGIGSRETPKDVLRQCELLSRQLSSLGYVLRSGGANGADTAFEKGSDQSEIFTAKSKIPDWALQTVIDFHPAYNRLSEYAIRLHARNAMILLGQDGKSPVDFVVCWTKEGKATGGTGQGIRIANHHGIDVYNLYHLDYRQILLLI